jgi:hypothetical protein
MRDDVGGSKSTRQNFGVMHDALSPTQRISSKLTRRRQALVLQDAAIALYGVFKM